MNRKDLDALAVHHGLSAGAVESMLALAGARPSHDEIAQLGVRVLRLAGVLSIAAGVVFFVAANWAGVPVFGRFLLVEGVLVAVVALALWRPPPDRVGRYALLLAFVVSGALMALFGQTYQSGADVYELFLSWTVLGFLFVAVAQWSVSWAAWVLVLNVALWLFFGARPETGVFWLLVSLWDMSQSELLLLPLVVNLVLWVTAVALEGSRWSSVAPAWLGRFVLACAVGFGTWACMLVIVDGGSRQGAAGLIVPLLAFGAVAMHTLRRRVDVFPLAAIEGSLILLSTVWIARAADFDEIGMFFVLSAWLIGTSTVSGHYLMRLVRAWEVGETEP